MRWFLVMVVGVSFAVLTTVWVSPVEATVSGDNGRIAFVKDVDGAGQIFMINPDGTDLYQVTSFTDVDGDFADINYLTWSPNGATLLFTTWSYGDHEDPGEIWTINADGTGLTFVTVGRVASWSPDGRSIAVSMPAVDEVTGLPSSVIGVVDIVTGDVGAVTESVGLLEHRYYYVPATTHDDYPVWYPDGLRVAFIRHFPHGLASQSNLYLYEVDVASGAVTELADAGFDHGSLDTSPTADRVLFLAKYSIGGDYLFIRVYDSATDTLSAPPMPTDNAGSASFAPSGDMLVAALWNLGEEPPHLIWIRDSDGHWAPLTEGRLPAWQPVNPYPVGLVDPTQGQWHLRYPDGHIESFYYGNPGDVPFMGDWDCDGIDTPGLYRQSDGYVYLRDSNTQGIADRSFFFGNPGDIPLAGDFNGDGCDTLSIYRPSEQRFHIINHLGTSNEGLGQADVDYVFGNPGDSPFVGDFDGDGIDTAGLHRATTGLVYYRNTHSQGTADNQFLFGDPGDHYTTNDWNSNGIDSPAVYRPSNTTHYFRFTNTQGPADAQYIWGQPDWQPVTGTYTNTPTLP
jgi:Tol biopolymer transport system component